MAVPSTRRPLPLTKRRDLKFQWMSFHGRPHVLVKDPLCLKYYRLLPIQHRLLELLDGEATWDAVYETLQSEFRGQQVTPAGLQQLIVDLHRKELIVSTRQGQAEETLRRSQRERRQKLKRLPAMLLFMKLPGWNADGVLRRLTPLSGLLFSPLAVAVWGLTIAGAWLFLLVHIEEFQRQLPAAHELFAMKNVIILWITIGAAKAIHELSHAVACRRFGGECHEIGVAFLIFSPCLYCDVSDSWMMERKSHRIYIALAGIWIELLLSAACIVLWWNTAPGLFHSICLQLLVVTSVSTVLFNANPLLRYDGYYVLSDLLEVPNLQQRGQQAVRQAVASTVCGVKLPRDPFADPDRFPLYLLYGVCSGIYRWLILFGIGLFLYGFLRPWGLQSFAVLYVLLSVLASVLMLGTMFGRILMHVRTTRPAALLRIAVGLIVAGGLVMTLWHYPLRDRAIASILIEPHRLQHVYADSPGELRDIFVSPGDHIPAGALIARLESLDVTQRLITLAGERQKWSAELAMARATSNPDLGVLVTRELQTLAYQQQAEQHRERRLLIRAPCEGRVVSTTSTLDGPSRTNSQSPSAENSSLNLRNLNAYIPQRTHLCSIAPDERWQAIAWVDQDQCQFLSVHQPVEVILSSYPGQTITGSIESISPSEESVVPGPVAEKYGGDLQTLTTEQGEAPNSATYRVAILLQPTSQELCLGMRGRVRYVRTEQSVGEWLTHAIYRSFLAL